MDKDTIKTIAVAVGTILAIWAERWYAGYRKKQDAKKIEEDRSKKTGIEFTSAIDYQVKHKENGMFKDYPYMRSFVIHFHNGEFTDARLSLIKMTIKHEVTGKSTVKKITEHYQGKPVPEMFSSMIRRVIFEGHYFISDRDQLNDNQALREWMTIYDVGSMLCVEIRAGVSRKIVAILVMQWKIKEGINEGQIPQIKEDKKAIENIYDTL